MQAVHDADVRERASAHGREGRGGLSVGLLGAAPHDPQKRAGREPGALGDAEQLVGERPAAAVFVEEHRAGVPDLAQERDERAPGSFMD